MKWRTAFFICLFLFVISIFALLFQTIGKLIHTDENPRQDLNAIIKIINKKDFSYEQITHQLQDNYFYYYDNRYFDNDTIELEKVNLYFKNGGLFKVEERWD